MSSDSSVISWIKLDGYTVAAIWNLGIADVLRKMAANRTIFTTHLNLTHYITFHDST